MKKLAPLFLMCLILVNMSSGCTAKKESAERSKTGIKVVAKVNGTTITEEDLSFRLRGAAHGGRVSTEDEQGNLDEAIKEELLYQQGLKLGLDKEPGYRAQITRLERQLAHIKRAEMTRRVYNTQVAAKVEISNQDAKNYYDKKVNQITTDLRLGVISFNKMEQAEEALKKIRSGATFESIARNVMGSKPGAGREPWDLGFVSWDQIPVDFVDTIYLLKPGEVSNIVSSKRTGYQVFKLFEIRRNPKADFTGMSSAIMNRLRDKQVMEAFEQYLDKLKKEAKIERF